MSDCFDHEAEAWDDRDLREEAGDYEPYERVPRLSKYDFYQEHKMITCKKCGIKNLHWGITTAGWRLYDGNGVMHSCAKKESE